MRARKSRHHSHIISKLCHRARIQIEFKNMPLRLCRLNLIKPIIFYALLSTKTDLQPPCQRSVRKEVGKANLQARLFHFYCSTAETFFVTTANILHARLGQTYLTLCCSLGSSFSFETSAHYFGWNRVASFCPSRASSRQRLIMTQLGLSKYLPAERILATNCALLIGSQTPQTSHLSTV